MPQSPSRLRGGAQRQDETVNAVSGASAASPDRLSDLMRAAAFGRFPPTDGAVEVLPRPLGPADALVAFAAHHALASDVEPDWVTATFPTDDLGAPMRATFLAELGCRLGAEAGTVDVVLAAVATPTRTEAAVEPAEETFSHPRLTRAHRYRTQVRPFRDGHGGVLTIGRGLAERVEVSIEVDAAARGAGRGSALARSALGLVTPGTPVFAQVSPGNAASLRCFLAAGYRPIAAEVLFHRRGR